MQKYNVYHVRSYICMNMYDLKINNIYTYIYIYNWNPNDPCFAWKRPCFVGLTFKNTGHVGSRYI